MTGYLKVQVHTGDDALPVANALVTVTEPDGRTMYRRRTDAVGNIRPLALPAPDRKYSLSPTNERPAYSTCHVDIAADGYLTLHIDGVPILDGETTILTENLQPLTEAADGMTDQYLDIAPPHILSDTPNMQDVPPPIAGDDSAGPPPQAPFLFRDGVVIPDYITVHLGIPSNAAARNVRVRFADYIKNVVSSEIYSTWPLNSLKSNIHAIVTFALNRVYTEWYRSRGFPFDITNSTAYDMAFREGGPVFEDISRLVDELFDTYARRIGFENPFFTQFCNGSTVTCSGLSQWGTVRLANQGMTPLEILHYYYPDDLELSVSDNIGGIAESFPGQSLRLGSQGEAVARMQVMLNRIRVNYPLIPRISNPNGVYGSDTEQAVRTFQSIFNMASDGVIGRATWNKITFLFVAVTRLAELESEGIRVTVGERPPTVVLNTGSRGADVMQLQFLLNTISVFYPSVPTVIQDGVFDTQTKNAVIEFQKTFGLTADGIVGPATWQALYDAYHGIDENVPRPPAPPVQPEGPPDFPGQTLVPGATGAAVRTMQAYLNTIRAVYPVLPLLVVDGFFGEETRRAVSAFQQQMFLPVTGQIDRATWDKIIETFRLVTGEQAVSLEYPGMLLRVGSRGPAVRLMQGFLSELRAPYPSLPRITVDGIFGPNTEAAVIGFQRLTGLTPDGIIGPITWYEIIRQRNQAV